MKKQILAFTFLFMVLASFLAFFPNVQAAMLENVYYIDAQQNRYYAVNTNHVSYRVFYLQGDSTVYVTAYWWDANTNYLIFQSPVTGRIYLRQESYSLSQLATQSWFNAPSIATPYFNFTVTFPSPWTTTPQTASLTFTLTNTQTFFAYDGAKVNYTIAKTYNVGTSTYKQVSTDNFVSASTNYQASISAPSTNVAYIHYNATAYGSVYYCILGAGNKWMTNTEYYAPLTYTHATLKTGSSTVTITTGTATWVSDIWLPNYYQVTFDVKFSSTTLTKIGTNTYTKASNIITASNGNQISVADNLNSLGYINLYFSSSTAVYYLYVQTVQVTFPAQTTLTQPLLLNLDTSGLTESLPNPNVAVYIPILNTWTSAVVINYGSADTYLLFNAPQVTVSNLTVRIAWTYPIQYEASTVTYSYATGANLVSLFPINGSYTLSSGVLTVEGAIFLGAHVGNTIVFDLDGSYTVNSASVGTLNATLTCVYPQTASSNVNGTFSFSRCLILYNTATASNITYTVSSPTFQSFQLDQIAIVPSGAIQGSWSYRLPIYITLSELPQNLMETGLVFRVVLPLRSWVSSGLLSPALEDLIFVDASMHPLPFYVYNVDVGVVYIRYDRVVTSSSIVVYVLLRNTQLWGSGNSFSTLSTFDRVNPRDFTDDFAYNVYYTYLAYNLLVVKPRNETCVKFGKTWFDFVAVNNTCLVEQHGSTVFYTRETDLALKNAEELIVYVDRQRMDDVLIWVDGDPKISFSLHEFNATPAYYVGYKDVYTVYAGRMVLFSYSFGDIQGSLQRPTQVSKPQAQAAAAPSMFDFWTLLPMLFILIVLAIIVRLMKGGVGKGASRDMLEKF